MSTTTALAPFIHTNTTVALTVRGRTVGTRHLLGTGPIAAARKALRETGLSANEASRKIAEYLKGGNGNLVWAQAQSYLETARAKGQFPTTFDSRDNSFCLRGSAAPVVKEKKVKLTKESVAAMSKEEREAILAILLGE